jgi:ribosomal-protein-alanine N-acetyltransferase
VKLADFSPRPATESDFAKLRISAGHDMQSWLWPTENNKEQKLLVFGEPAIGFVALQVVLDEAEVQMFWVEHASRGKGLANAAFAQIKEMLRTEGIKTMFLEVAVDNFAAIKIYENAGFLRQGIRRQYYKRENGSFCDAIKLCAAI